MDAPSIILVLYWLLPPVAGQAIETCDNPEYKSIPFLRPPVTDYDPLNWDNGQWISYGIGLVKSSSGIFTLALVVLSAVVFLGFLVWRSTQCLRVVCCHRESRKDPEKILGSRRLKWLKVVVLVLGLLTMALTIYSMTAVDHQLPKQFWQQYSESEAFIGDMVEDLEKMQNTTLSMNKGVNDLVYIIDVELNTTDMKLDVQHIGSFLDSIPPPKRLMDNLKAVGAEMEELKQVLGSLEELTGASGALMKVRQSVDTLSGAGEQLIRMSSSVIAYTQAITALRSSPPSEAAPQFELSHRAVTLTEWDRILGDMLGAVETIRGASASPQDPYLTFSQDLNKGMGLLEDLREGRLRGLAEDLALFNQLYNRNASKAFDDLTRKLRMVNDTIIELPSSMAPALWFLNSTGEQLRQLYAIPQGGLRSPPESMRAISEQLISSREVPVEVNNLKAACQAASRRLRRVNTTALQDLSKQLEQLRDDLPIMNQDWQRNQVALTAYQASPSDTAYNTLTTTTREATAGRRRNDFVNSCAALSSAPARQDLVTYLAELPGGTMLTLAHSALISYSSRVREFPDVTPYVDFLSDMVIPYELLDDPKSEAVMGLIEPIDQLGDRAANITASSREEISDVAGDIGMAKRSIQKDVLLAMARFQANLEPQVEDGYSQAYTVILVILAVMLTAILGLLVLMFINCPGGVNFALLALSVATMVLLLVPIVSTAGILAAHDACPNAEKVITQQAQGHKDLLPLLSYYFYQSGGNNLTTVLKNAKIVDIERLKSRVLRAQARAAASMVKGIKYKSKIADIVEDMGVATNSTLAQMDALISGPASFESVNGQYRDLKRVACCNVPDDFYAIYLAAILTGVSAVVLQLLAFVVLREMDKLPTETCCGCERFRISNFHSQDDNLPLTDSGNLTSHSSGGADVHIYTPDMAMYHFYENYKAAGGPSRSSLAPQVTPSAVPASPLPATAAARPSGSSVSVMNPPPQVPAMTWPVLQSCSQPPQR